MKSKIQFDIDLKYATSQMLIELLGAHWDLTWDEWKTISEVVRAAKKRARDTKEQEK